MPDRLLPYGLGALHAILLLLAFVGVLLAGGGSGNALGGIGTVPGVAIGLWLALLSWGATGWALRGQELEAPDVRTLLGRAGLAGFGAGALFGPGLLVGAALALRVFEPEVLLFATFAMPFAGAFGAVAALLLALVDIGLYKGAARGVRLGRD